MYKVLSIDLDWLQSHFHLKKLNTIFFDKVKTADRIVFSRHHHMIVKELMNKDNIILHNIDHHHDICYEDWQVPDIQNGRATHGCWVGNLIYLRKLNEYHWYKNGNSQVLKPYHNSYIFSTDLIKDIDLPYHVEDDLTKAELIDRYNLIFVCSSPEYMNNEYNIVYDVYKDMCKTNYNFKTDETHITPDLPNYPIRIYK